MQDLLNEGSLSTGCDADAGVVHVPAASTGPLSGDPIDVVERGRQHGGNDKSGNDAPLGDSPVLFPRSPAAHAGEQIKAFPLFASIRDCHKNADEWSRKWFSTDSCFKHIHPVQCLPFRRVPARTVLEPVEGIEPRRPASPGTG